MRDSKTATPAGAMRKSSRKASERKSRRKQTRASAGARASKAMKENIWHNWLMEENYL